MRYWFTQLRRLRCDKVCKLETQGTHHYSSSLSLKSGDWWSSTKTSRESEFSLTLPFILPTQMGGTRPSHTEGGPSALLSSPVQKLISSGNAFIDTLRIMSNQISRCSTAQSRWHVNYVSYYVIYDILCHIMQILRLETQYSLCRWLRTFHPPLKILLYEIGIITWLAEMMAVPDRSVSHLCTLLEDISWILPKQ